MGQDNEFVDDVDNTDTTDDAKDKSGGGLRKQLENALAEIAGLKKARDEATEKATKLELTTVFTRLGVPEKVRTLYNGEPNEEAVTKWVSDYQDVFGLELNDGQDDKETDDKAADLKNVQGASGAGSAPKAAELRHLTDLLSKQGPRDPQDLVKALMDEGFAGGDITIPRELM